MNTHRISISAALVFVGVVTLAGSYLPLAPTDALGARSASVHRSHYSAVPRTTKKAARLVRQSAAQLAGDYAKGRAKNVCADLTAKARKSLGGDQSCLSGVQYASDIDPISKISIQKITIRRNRTWANVSGYLNGDRTLRLVVAFKWESGRYRLDHALSEWKGLLD